MYIIEFDKYYKVMEDVRCTGTNNLHNDDGLLIFENKTLAEQYLLDNKYKLQEDGSFIGAHHSASGGFEQWYAICKIKAVNVIKDLNKETGVTL